MATLLTEYRMLSLLFGAFRQTTAIYPASHPISVLGLDETNLEASVYNVLSDGPGENMALSLTEDSARSFLDILQKVDSTLFLHMGLT